MAYTIRAILCALVLLIGGGIATAPALHAEEGDKKVKVDTEAEGWRTSVSEAREGNDGYGTLDKTLADAEKPVNWGAVIMWTSVLAIVAGVLVVMGILEVRNGGILAAKNTGIALGVGAIAAAAVWAIFF